LRFPQGSGYNRFEMENYPGVPPRLTRIFSNNPLFFVTFCTYRRRKLLDSSDINVAFIEFANQAYANHAIAVGRYVIMPDHAHLFVRGPDDFRLGAWIGMLKQALAKRIPLPKASLPVWQRGFFDHLLRSNESYAQKWEYVRQNPVRAGLVTIAEDWPYSGEIVIIDRA
jgi:putative transposase